jgi:mRNA-degrading endonuclease RelE of RelBE toxin-antitoxin system
MDRSITFTPEFEEFYISLDLRSRKKIAQVIDMLRCADIISSKFIKKLVNTRFYEMRVSAGNEYRVIVFSIDDNNIILAREVTLLNGFMKKGVKDYGRQIEKANNILDTLLK